MNISTLYGLYTENYVKSMKSIMMIIVFNFNQIVFIHMSHSNLYLWSCLFYFPKLNSFKCKRIYQITRNYFFKENILRQSSIVPTFSFHQNMLIFCHWFHILDGIPITELQTQWSYFIQVNVKYWKYFQKKIINSKSNMNLFIQALHV